MGQVKNNTFAPWILVAFILYPLRLFSLNGIWTLLVGVPALDQTVPLVPYSIDVLIQYIVWLSVIICLFIGMRLRDQGLAKSKRLSNRPYFFLGLGALSFVLALFGRAAQSVLGIFGFDLVIYSLIFAGYSFYITLKARNGAGDGPTRLMNVLRTREVTLLVGMLVGLLLVTLSQFFDMLGPFFFLIPLALLLGWMWFMKNIRILGLLLLGVFLGIILYVLGNIFIYGIQPIGP